MKSKPKPRPLLSVNIEDDLDKIISKHVLAYQLSRADIVRIALRSYFGLTSGKSVLK